jgi:predicted tellurium resistance membrane protein TerC
MVVVVIVTLAVAVAVAVMVAVAAVLTEFLNFQAFLDLLVFRS